MSMHHEEACHVPLAECSLLSSMFGRSSSFPYSDVLFEGPGRHLPSGGIQCTRPSPSPRIPLGLPPSNANGTGDGKRSEWEGM